MEFNNPAKQYKESENWFYSCQYHVVFCSKYRRKIFKDGVDVRVKEIFLGTAQKYNFEILEMEIAQNYVHLLISCNPLLGIADCVRRLKTSTAKTLKEEFPHISRTIPSLWTRSVFVSTIGSVENEDIRDYIESQKGK